MGDYRSDKANSRFYGLKFSRNTDDDLIEHLDNQESVQKYIKRLIKADMMKEGKTMMIRTNLDEYEVRYGYRPVVGGVYAIAERENVQTGKTVGYLFVGLDDENPEGFPGNADPAVHRFHGWRGTTNDISVTALGVFTVLDITEQKNGISRIRLSGDLHPDWP